MGEWGITTELQQPSLECLLHRLLQPESPSVSRSAMAIRSRSSGSDSTIDQQPLPECSTDHVAVPVAAFLALQPGVQQQVERHIRSRQQPPELIEHLEAVAPLQPGVRSRDQQVDVRLRTRCAPCPGAEQSYLRTRNHAMDHGRHPLQAGIDRQRNRGAHDRHSDASHSPSFRPPPPIGASRLRIWTLLSLVRSPDPALGTAHPG